MYMSRKFFYIPCNCICLLQNYIFSYLYLKDIYKTLKELTILLNLQRFKFHGSLRKEKNGSYYSLNTTPYVAKLTLV